jgi:hypothetical protein
MSRVFPTTFHNFNQARSSIYSPLILNKMHVLQGNICVMTYRSLKWLYTRITVDYKQKVSVTIQFTTAFYPHACRVYKSQYESRQIYSYIFLLT